MSILTDSMMKDLEALQPDAAAPLDCDAVFASGCWGCGDACTFDYTA